MIHGIIENDKQHLEVLTKKKSHFGADALGALPKPGQPGKWLTVMRYHLQELLATL